MITTHFGAMVIPCESCSVFFNGIHTRTLCSSMIFPAINLHSSEISRCHDHWGAQHPYHCNPAIYLVLSSSGSSPLRIRASIFALLGHRGSTSTTQKPDGRFRGGNRWECHWTYPGNDKKPQTNWVLHPQNLSGVYHHVE